MKHWTRETILMAFRRFYDEHGYQPVTRECGRFHGLPSWYVVVREFGSWNAAVKAAGFRPYPARSSAQAKTMAHRDRKKAVA